MLAADKLQLQSTLKQQATALKEKEFNLHHSNLMTVGTQAAVLAGLDVTMFIEFQPPPNQEWAFIIIPRALKFIYYILITSAFCANILVVSQTTILSVLGASLALRGPDGSMMTATDGLYQERSMVFRAFGHGLILTIGSVVMCVWLHLHWEASLVCCGISVYTILKMRSTYYRIVKKFDFDESLTVDLNDIFSSGPAVIPSSAFQAVTRFGMGDFMNRSNNSGKTSFDHENDRSNHSSNQDEEENLMRSRSRRPSPSSQHSSNFEMV